MISRDLWRPSEELFDGDKMHIERNINRPSHTNVKKNNLYTHTHRAYHSYTKNNNTAAGV